MTAGGYGSGGYGYGSTRATDADRETVRVILQDAHAQGRLDWNELDSRQTALNNAQTYDQLSALTSDLTGQMPASQPQGYQSYPTGMATQATNSLAIASLICGIVQIFIPFFAAIAAVILGHVARRQIRQTGEQGAGMAIAGMVLGYVGLALTIISVILFVAFVVVVAHNTQVPPPNFNVGP